MELKTSGSAFDACADTGDDTEARSSVVSLLTALCQPTPSQLACKRTIQRNPVPPTGAKHCTGSTVNDRNSVKPIDCIKQYDKGHYQVSA